jgi:BCD family chlorophyll transporter-like MFS transporter
MSALLEMNDVFVQAGSLQILSGVDLEIAPGQVLAIVGPNGAGKTTLLDAVSGIVPGVSGSIKLGGVGRTRKQAAYGRPRPGVGRVFQGSPLPETLTVAEVAAIATGHRRRAARLLKQFGLLKHGSLFVSELSTGMRRILDIAIATVGSPAVLLLDEPSSGLAQSEIEHLAAVIRWWRDSSGAAVIMVEHDAWLVGEVADEVAMMDGGKIVTRGRLEDVLKAQKSRAKPRMRSPIDPEFRESLERVTSQATSKPPVERTVSTWTMIRLGLREMSAGMGSVLLLGVLNRVLKVELGISLGVVSAILASYNLAAPIALVVGHRSDRYPIFGRRRTPYIIGGAIVAGIAMAAAPHVAGQLADGVTAFAVISSVALFVAMGLGIWGGGTVFLALLADIVPERERPHAISIAYIMLMLGVMTGVGLTVTIIEEDASNIGTLFAIGGLLIAVMSTIAVWGKEPRVDPAQIAQTTEAPPRFREAFGGIFSMSQARLFFAFSTLSVLFLFLQQSVLEPYGGDVLGMNVRTTSTFNTVMFLGILTGMWSAGRPFASRYGHKKIARVGLYAGFVSFGMLAAAAASKAEAPSWLAIFAVGLATGVFTVAALSLMMGMVDPRRTAMFMGVWTVGRSIADFSAVLGGGVLFEVARRIANSEATGYASVFAVEAIGLALCLPLLARINPKRFREEAGVPESEAEPAGVEKVPVDLA